MAVDVLVAVEQGVDLRGAECDRIAELTSDVDGPGDVLAHDSGLDRRAGVVADGEDAMALHEDCS